MVGWLGDQGSRPFSSIPGPGAPPNPKGAVRVRFPPSDEWLGLLVFVFGAIIVINTLAARIPALQQIEGGL